MNDLISIIIPVYRAEKYIHKCLNSIINQTYKHLEIILIDDGSPDMCPKICDEYAQRDNRIKVFHKTNGGPSSAKNLGISVATGTYIGFVDSDDWVDKDMFDFLLKNAKKFDADISQCGYYYDYENGKSYSINNCEPVVYSDKTDMKKKILSANTEDVIMCNKIYKASLVKGKCLDVTLNNSEDWKFNYDLIEHTNLMICFNSPKYHYYLQNSSITRNISEKSILDGILGLEYFYENEKNNIELLPYLAKCYVIQATNILNSAIRNKKTNTSEYKHITKIIKKHQKFFLRYISVPSYKVKIRIMCNCMWLYILYMRFVMRNR